MKSKMNVIIAAFVLLLGSVIATNAQSHHVGNVGEGPHGGTVQEADPNHAEILVKDSKVYIYLLDGDAQPTTYKNCIVTAKVKGKSVSAKFKNYSTVKAPAAMHH